MVLLCVVLGWLLRRRMTAEALCLLLQFQTCLRPGDITGLRRYRLVEQRPTAGAAYDVWAINVAPFSEGRPAKTGLFDESLTIDRLPWLGRWLGILKGQGAPNKPLWPFNLAQLSRTFAQATADCGLSHLRPVLYSIIRHDGASEDLLRGTRSLSNDFRRGRWRSWSSVRRYGKEAKLLTEIAKVPAPLLRYGRVFERDLEMMFERPDLVPAIPAQ